MCPFSRWLVNTSIRFTEHLALEGIRPSIGSVGDAYDNALMETINGLFKAECIRTTVFCDGPARPSPTSHRLHTDPQPVHLLHPGRPDPALVPVPLRQRRRSRIGRVLLNIVGLLLLLLAVAGLYLYLDRKLPEKPTHSTATDE